MPIKRAAVRQLRKDRKRALRNQAVRSELKTLKKRVQTLLAQHKPDEARTFLPLIMKRLDQAAAKNIIHKNTASRSKGRITRQLARGPAPLPKPMGGVSTTPRSTPPAPTAESSVPS